MCHVYNVHFTGFTGTDLVFLRLKSNSQVQGQIKTLLCSNHIFHIYHICPYIKMVFIMYDVNYLRISFVLLQIKHNEKNVNLKTEWKYIFLVRQTKIVCLWRKPKLYFANNLSHTHIRSEFHFNVSHHVWMKFSISTFKYLFSKMVVCVFLITNYYLIWIEYSMQAFKLDCVTVPIIMSSTLENVI